MRTFIFSNCKKSTEEEFDIHLRSLNITQEDNLVFLNKCVNLYNRSFFNGYPNIFVILRAFKMHGTTGFFGHEETAMHRHLFNKIYLFDHKREQLNIVQGNKDGSASKLNLPNDWMADYISVTGKIPTTGYAAFFLAQHIFNIPKDNIYMVNFYGSRDNSTSKCEEHDWEYEEQKLKDMMVNYVYA